MNFIDTKRFVVSLIAYIFLAQPLAVHAISVLGIWQQEIRKREAKNQALSQQIENQLAKTTSEYVRQELIQIKQEVTRQRDMLTDLNQRLELLRGRS